MRRDGLRHQHIFERNSFTADLECAVIIATFVFMVKVNEQLFHVRILVDDFFRQHQYAAFVHACDGK